ncbi:MAG: hypothetical protein CL529_12655 [Aequorivita sp.]|nr:hypothetical protein [Aequorivita sp.]|tara:strand:+ start:24042 stop:24836 length:795 start_codon:yes stop_codon:yes gene_type:complete
MLPSCFNQLQQGACNMTKKGSEVTTTEGNDLTNNEQMQNALLEIVQRTDIDPERLEKFLDLQIKMEDRQNLQAFNEAFAKFQKECPIISKTKKVEFGQTKYDYAPLDEMVHIIRPILGKYGLSFSFNLSQDSELMCLTTIVSHSSGCSKDFQYFFNDLHDDKRMNQSQRRKSAITFAKRSALENALGIVTAGEDDDARRAVDNPATEEQLEKIQSLLKTTDTPESQFLNYLKIESLGMLSVVDAKKALNLLNSKRNALVSKEGK